MLDESGADHLKPGMSLPSVLLSATDRNGVDLSALKGRSIVAVSRPGQPNPLNWDEIPGAHGSTPELEGFRDHHAGFMRLEIRLFGVSRQTSDYQRELVERLGLPFPVLSDAAGRFAAALRLPTFTTGGELYLKRLTLVVRDGRIERVSIR